MKQTSTVGNETKGGWGSKMEINPFYWCVKTISHSETNQYWLFTSIIYVRGHLYQREFHLSMKKYYEGFLVKGVHIFGSST